MSDLELLRKQRDEMNRRIAELEAAERAYLIEQIRALMAKGGLTLADIGGDARAQKQTTPKVAKYVNPSTGATWGGRGAKPRWIIDALAQGATLSSFINPEA